MFEFSNLTEKHELFSNKNKKVVGKIKIGTPKNIWIDDFVCRGSKIFSFRCGNDSEKKLKGFSKSQSKHNKFEEKLNCLDVEEYQKDCDN